MSSRGLCHHWGPAHPDTQKRGQMPAAPPATFPSWHSTSRTARLRAASPPEREPPPGPALLHRNLLRTRKVEKRRRCGPRFPTTMQVGLHVASWDPLPVVLSCDSWGQTWGGTGRAGSTRPLQPRVPKSQRLTRAAAAAAWRQRVGRPHGLSPTGAACSLAGPPPSPRRAGLPMCPPRGPGL